MPTPRYDVGFATGGDGRIYAIGGIGPGVLNNFDIVEAYSPTTNTWTTAASLPTRRATAAATTGPDGRIYVIGGCELVIPNDCTSTTRVDVYAPQTDSWQTLSSTLVVHREGAAVTSGKQIFAIGGETDAVESARINGKP